MMTPRLTKDSNTIILIINVLLASNQPHYLRLNNGSKGRWLVRKTQTSILELLPVSCFHHRNVINKYIFSPKPI